MLNKIDLNLPLNKIHLVDQDKKYMHFLHLDQYPFAENLFELKEIEPFNIFCKNFLIKNIDNKIIGSYFYAHRLKVKFKSYFLYIGDDNSDKENFTQYYEDFGGLIIYKGDLSSVFLVPSQIEAPLLITDND